MQILLFCINCAIIRHTLRLTLLGGLLSMAQVMKADLSPPASDLTTASPDITEGGSENSYEDDYVKLENAIRLSFSIKIRGISLLCLF